MGTAVSPLTPSSAPVGPVRVLVVDDDAMVRRAITRILRRFCALREAASADEAETALAEGGVDFILLDVRMPGRSGLDLYRTLSPAQQAQVCFLTGGAASPADEAALALLPVLRKPFTAEELLSRLPFSPPVATASAV